MRLRALIAAAAALALMLSGGPLAAQQIKDERLFAQSFEAARQALLAYGAFDDDAEMRRVTDMGYELAEVSAFRDYPFTFHLIDMPDPNAFALPGGQIFITRGMLRMGLTDDELAGLLGHEIGHVVENHGLRTQKRARLLNVLGQALVIGVLVNEMGQDRQQRNDGYNDPFGGTSDRGSRVQGAAAASLVTSELLLRSYSREFEDEADAVGQRLAAMAGYSPAGTASLMTKMGVRIPQSKEYGYWATHPFFDQRVQHAEAREGLLEVAAQRPDTRVFRAKTQQVLLDWASKDDKRPPEVLDFARTAALRTWPQGEAADSIRLAKLHEVRDLESEKTPLGRNFSLLIADYRKELEEVRSLTPDSPLIATLEKEIGEFEARRANLYDRALQVLAGGVYETEFMETFLANYPQSSEVARLDLELGEAYSRLGRHKEAVEHYLHAAEAAPDSEPGRRARRGLVLLSTRLNDLAALERLTSEPDAEIASGAAKRLDQRASTFERLEEGSAYLEAFPEGAHAEAVAARLNHLADDLYGEVVLYQTVGDAAQAVSGIQRILAHAPFSPAAERLRQRMVVES